MSFKLSEICEEISRIEIPMKPEELEAIGVHIEEDPSADEAEGFKDRYIRAVHACMAKRRSSDHRAMLIRAAATDAIFMADPVEAYLAWELTDSWKPYIEEEFPERREGERSPLMPEDGLPDGFVGPGDALEYELPSWEAIEEVKARQAEMRKEENAQRHRELRELALSLGRYGAPALLAFVKENRDRLLDILWETDGLRRQPLRRPDLPALKLSEAREEIERYLDSLVVVPAVRAAHGDPVEARRRVREALRIFCNGGEAPKGKLKAPKYVKGFGLDPKVLIQASKLEARLKRALEEYHLRQEIWKAALELFKAAALLRPNVSASFGEKVSAGVIHSFPRKWKEERIDGQVVFHPGDWDESRAKGSVAIRTKPLLPWAYLAGGFSTTADAVNFLALPHTQERLKLLGQSWVEESKRIVFGAYKRIRS